jgi:hypothetical protein
MIQQELKNRLDPKGFVFLKGDPYREQWKAGFNDTLLSILGNDLIDTATDITNNYMDPKYKSIVTFVAINIMLKFYYQEHLVDPSQRVNFDYLDYCTVPKFVTDPFWAFTLADLADPSVLTIGPSIKDCITEDCITMPYDVILDNKFDEFLKTIKRTLGIELDSEQIGFVQKNLDYYCTNQSPGLMEDPVKYYRNLGQEAYRQIMILKGLM